MKQAILLFFSILTISAYGQDKYNYVHFNKLTTLDGTAQVIAYVENVGKMYSSKGKYLLFINTSNGQSRQVDFPADASIGSIKQVKIDSLQLNLVLVAASMGYADPTQLIVISTDGQEKVQLTEDKFYVRTWEINHQTGVLVVTGHYDSNNNGKYDKTDKNEILLYDLKTLKLKARI